MARLTKALSIGAFGVCLASARGDLIIDLRESGGDLLIDVSGSLNLNDFTKQVTIPLENNILSISSSGESQSSQVNLGFTDIYLMTVLGPSLTKTTGDFPSGSVTETGGLTGTDDAGVGFSTFISGDDPFSRTSLFRIYVPFGYTSGSALNASFAQSGVHFDDLGVVAGQSWGLKLGNGDTITFTAVPEPAGLITSVIVCCTLCGVRRRPRDGHGGLEARRGRTQCHAGDDLVRRREHSHLQSP